MKIDRNMFCKPYGFKTYVTWHQCQWVSHTSERLAPIIPCHPAQFPIFSIFLMTLFLPWSIKHFQSLFTRSFDYLSQCLLCCLSLPWFLDSQWEISDGIKMTVPSDNNTIVYFLLGGGSIFIEIENCGNRWKRWELMTRWLQEIRRGPVTLNSNNHCF